MATPIWFSPGRYEVILTEECCIKYATPALLKNDLMWIRNPKFRASLHSFTSSIIIHLIEAAKRGTTLNVEKSLGADLVKMGREAHEGLTTSLAKRVLNTILANKKLVDTVRLGFSSFGDVRGRVTSVLPAANIVQNVSFVEGKGPNKEVINKIRLGGRPRSPVVVRQFDGREKAVPKAEEAQFLNKMSKEATKRVGNGKKQINFRRIYNGGLLIGGRVYAGYQQKSKEARLQIMIDGDKDVAEVDYRANHLNMLYKITDSKLFGPDHDPYAIGKGYDLTRDEAKKIIMAVINSTRPVNVLVDNREGKPILNRSYHEVAEIINEVIQMDDTLAEIEGSGVGVALQKLEGDIAIEVMRRLYAKGILALPVHDSFIVRSCYKQELADTMVEVWDEVTDKYCSPEILNAMCKASRDYLKRKREWEKEEEKRKVNDLSEYL